MRIALTNERRGEVLVLISVVLWGALPVMAILALHRIPPLFTGALTTCLSAVFFAVLLTGKHRWHELNCRAAWPAILKTSLSIGVLFYGITFIGIRQTTAGNASVMSLMEVFFAYLILGLLLRHEPLVPRRVIGGLCMLFGALIILLPKASGWHAGDLIIAGASAIPPLGNKWAQEARKFVSAECIMFCRSVIGGVLLFAIALLVEPLPGIADVQLSAGYLLFSGILLLGWSKILWIDSLHLITVTKATSFLSIVPLSTFVIAAFLLHEPIHAYQLLSLIPIIAGIFLLRRRVVPVQG